MIAKLIPHEMVAVFVPEGYELGKDEFPYKEGFNERFYSTYDTKGNRLKKIYRLVPLTPAEEKINEIIDQINEWEKGFGLIAETVIEAKKKLDKLQEILDELNEDGEGK